MYQDSSFLTSFRNHLFIFFLILLFFSCGSSMEKIEIEVGGEKFTVEVARQPEDQRKGLMFRDSLGEREGMLFAYDYDKPLKFWNNNVQYVNL